MLTSREAEEAMGRHGVALLALSHAYRVPWLKRGCEAAAAARVSAENVMDVLKLARMCDALWLRQRCMRQVAKDFAAVQQTEGWRFVQKHDPALELEILQFLEEADQVRDLHIDACNPIGKALPRKRLGLYAVSGEGLVRVLIPDPA